MNYIDKYIRTKWNRKKNLYHAMLAISQMMHKPFLNILLLPIAVFTIIYWAKIDFIITLFDVPKFILPVYTVVVKAFGVLLPILLWGLIDAIGSIIARKDEALLQTVFKEMELRGGTPILIFKNTDKETGETIREFYSPLPKHSWVERQNEISDALNITITEINYVGSNRNKIYFKSKKGNFTNHKLFDNDLEKDMENIK